MHVTYNTYIGTRSLTYTIYLKALPETAFYNIQNRRTKLFFRFHYTRTHIRIYIYDMHTMKASPCKVDWSQDLRYTKHYYNLYKNVPQNARILKVAKFM